MDKSELPIFLKAIEEYERLSGSEYSLKSLIPYLTEIFVRGSKFGTPTHILHYILTAWARNKLSNEETLEWINNCTEKPLAREIYLAGLSIMDEENPPRDFERLMHYFRRLDYQDDQGHDVTLNTSFLAILKQYCRRPL